MEYPKTLAALREQEDRSWAVADALADEIQTHPDGRVLNGEYVRCAAWLAEQGYDRTPEWLRYMRITGLKFRSSEERKWDLPFRLYMEAAKSANWTPALMDEAEKKGLTLRDFSYALTGKLWADDDVEAAKRVLSDPDKAQAVLEELPPAKQADIVHHAIANPGVQQTLSSKDYSPPVPKSPAPKPPTVTPQPYLHAEPDPEFEQKVAEDQELLDNRAAIATAISKFQEVYERGISTGHEAIQADLSRAGKWLAAVMTLADGKSLDQELAEFLEGDQK